MLLLLLRILFRHFPSDLQFQPNLLDLSRKIHQDVANKGLQILARLFVYIVGKIYGNFFLVEPKSIRGQKGD